MDIFSLIIVLLLLIFVFPFIGRKIYFLSTNKVLSIYLLSLAVFFAFNIAFVDNFKPTQIIEILAIYWRSTITFEWLFFYMFVFYFIGGIGFFGSLAEKAGELIEDSKLFSDLKKRTTPKTFIAYLLYGYCFAFGVYSGAESLIILLGVSYKSAFNFVLNILSYLQFKSPLIYIIGISLFSIKAFKYGYFSKEFWKYELTYEERRDTFLRYLRKFIVIFFYCWGVYLAVLLYYIDYFGLTTPFDYNDLDTLILVFYISLYLESIYFFKNKQNLVHHLKVQQKDYKKKVDESIELSGKVEQKEKDWDFDEEDIKFV
ncbi:MAG: hypothetical protein ACTSRZ_07605 [Promethearchaeota archaeon]